MEKTSKFIKSPLNYIGGKQKILPQILPLFPKNINCFVDLFAGGGNVGINVSAKKIILNDNLTHLIDLYKKLKNTAVEAVFKHIYDQVDKFKLSLTNEDGYKQLRTLYNSSKNPLDLFVLIAYSFNHQIRFNNSHEFNNPFGKNRSCYNASMEKNLKTFLKKLQTTDIELFSDNFQDFDTSSLCSSDFLYCDPPYLITTGTYNDGKRGFTGWGVSEETELLKKLDSLDQKGIKFALSNVLTHKGKINFMLESWLLKNKHYITHNITMNYSNSNYQTLDRNKTATQEVLITNYIPEKEIDFNELPLFERSKNDAFYRQQRKFA